MCVCTFAFPGPRLVAMVSATNPDNEQAVRQYSGHIQRGSMVPEIMVTDHNAPLFDVDWLNSCNEKVTFGGSNTESFLAEVKYYKLTNHTVPN